MELLILQRYILLSLEYLINTHPLTKNRIQGPLFLEFHIKMK